MIIIEKTLVLISDPWVLFGLFGQFIFFSRVLLQWIASERKKAIVIPINYWRLSILGAIMLFIYSIHRQDVVFIIAYVLNILIFSRSLVIHKNQKNREKDDIILNIK